MLDVQTDADDDLLADEVVRDPYGYFGARRRSEPVQWNARHRAWILTRYDHVQDALRDPRMSSDRIRPLLADLDGPRRERMGPVLELMSRWMVVSDAPEHTRLRRLAHGAFNPRRVAALEPRIRQIADELIVRFVESGETDFVEHVAFPLPATVIAEIMGVPVEDRGRFRRWSHQLQAVAFGGGGEGRADRHRESLAGLEELLSYFDGLIEHARRHPDDGTMISALAAGDG
ncbi:MAG: cytochrome P450, partial [Solirubrobacteraceae bacterium]